MSGLATARAGSSRSPWICYANLTYNLYRLMAARRGSGLTDTHGTPLLKPWTIAVSNASLVEQLKDFRCDKTHEHGKIAGIETAKTAYVCTTLGCCAKPSTGVWLLMKVIGEEETFPLR